MPQVSINGIQLDYQEYGQGEAIVFCHGAGGNLLPWWQQIPHFSESYRCVTFSHRGFGHSYDQPDGPGMKSFVDDLVGLLDYLGIDSVHLVAQSMGGRTALGFAVERPARTRSLVLADTTGGMGEPDVEQALADWRARQTSTRELGFRALAPGFGIREPELANLYLQISRDQSSQARPRGRDERRPRRSRPLQPPRPHPLHSRRGRRPHAAPRHRGWRHATSPAQKSCEFRAVDTPFTSRTRTYSTSRSPAS